MQKHESDAIVMFQVFWWSRSLRKFGASAVLTAFIGSAGLLIAGVPVERLFIAVALIICGLVLAWRVWPRGRAYLAAVMGDVPEGEDHVHLMIRFSEQTASGGSWFISPWKSKKTSERYYEVENKQGKKNARGRWSVGSPGGFASGSKLLEGDYRVDFTSDDGVSWEQHLKIWRNNDSRDWFQLDTKP